jgi:GTP-binding protein
MKTYPIISLIGRPNVGKSTLFNKLVGGVRKSLTYDRPGVTRDRQYRLMKLDAMRAGEGFEEANMVMVDTGGFLPDLPKQKEGRGNLSQDEWQSRHHQLDQNSDQFFRLMQNQSLLAIDESDLVLMVVDGREGLNPYEESIVKILRQKKKDFWLIINKCDNESPFQSMEFYSLPISDENILNVSAEHAHGLLQLREKLYDWWCEWQNKIDDEASLASENGAIETYTSPYPVLSQVAIIGNPNVGKSTLMNQLLETNRSLVSHVAGTTTDPVETFWHLDFSAEFPKDKSSLPECMSQGPISLKLIDTAGIRRAAAKKDIIEEQSIYRSLRCISEANIVLLMTDVDRGISQQDKRLVALALDQGKSVIVVVNKIDLLPKEKRDQLPEWIELVKKQNPWMSYCAVVCISAKSRFGIDTLKYILKNTLVVLNSKLSTGELNRVITALIEKNPTRVDHTNYLKVKYAAVVKSNPPTILLFSNRALEVPLPYRRYLAKGIRNHFSLFNTPVHLIFRKWGEHQKSPGDARNQEEDFKEENFSDYQDMQ